MGICVSADCASAVALHGDVIAWRRNVSRRGERSLEASLETLLHDVPRERFFGNTAFAAVGPAASQLRNIGNAGWTRNAQVAAGIVAHAPGRFFLVNGIPVATTGIDTSRMDEGWVGAMERPVVDAIIEACLARGLTLETVGPAAVSLGEVVPDGALAWQDGEVTMLATYELGRIRSHRRVHIQETPERSPTLQRGTEVAALAAARAGRAGRMLTVLRAQTAHGSRRVTVAAACLVAALGFALVAPPIAAMRAAAAARAALAVIARSAARAHAAERELNQAASIVHELNAFAQGARSASLRLAALTQGIEAPTMLLSIQGDTASATIVARTPRAAELLAMLDSIPEIDRARVTGSVTSERQPGTITAAPALPTGINAEAAMLMERVTARFMWKAGVAVTRGRGR